MKTLYVFDFDGTLFRSPYPPKEWKKNPDDWWRIGSSLNPPCVPEKPDSGWWNGDVVDAAKKAISDKDGIAVLITGRRVESFKVRILKLLAYKGLSFDHVFMKNKTGTVAYKIEQIRKLVEQYKPERVEIWDDRKPHLKRITEAAKSLGLEAIPHKVEDRPRELACSFSELQKAESVRTDPFSKVLYGGKVLGEEKMSVEWVEGVKKGWDKWISSMVRRQPSERPSARAALINDLKKGIEFIINLQEHVFVRRGMMSFGADNPQSREYSMQLAAMGDNPVGAISWILAELESNLKQVWETLANMQDTASSAHPMKNIASEAWKDFIENQWKRFVKIVRSESGKLFKILDRTAKQMAKAGIDVSKPGAEDMEVSIGRLKLIWPHSEGSFHPGKISKEMVGGGAVMSPMMWRKAINTVKRVADILERNGAKHLLYGNIFFFDPVDAPQVVNNKGDTMTAGGGWNSKDDDMMFFVPPGDEEENQFMAQGRTGLFYSLFHEMGHRHWFKFMRKPQREGFKDFFEKVQPISVYGSTAPEEEFAETFASYMLRMEMTPDQRERFKAFVMPGGKLDVIPAIESKRNQDKFGRRLYDTT